MPARDKAQAVGHEHIQGRNNRAHCGIADHNTGIVSHCKNTPNNAGWHITARTRRTTQEGITLKGTKSNAGEYHTNDSNTHAHITHTRAENTGTNTRGVPPSTAQRGSRHRRMHTHIHTHTPRHSGAQGKQGRGATTSAQHTHTTPTPPPGAPAHTRNPRRLRRCPCPTSLCTRQRGHTPAHHSASRPRTRLLGAV